MKYINVFMNLLRILKKSNLILFNQHFKNLDNGGDIIYLLSKKICDKFDIGEYDLFFSIIIKDNIFRLEELLQKNNIEEKYDKLINKLIDYKEIKNKLVDISLENLQRKLNLKSLIKFLKKKKMIKYL